MSPINKQRDKTQLEPQIYSLLCKFLDALGPCSQNAQALKEEIVRNYQLPNGIISITDIEKSQSACNSDDASSRSQTTMYISNINITGATKIVDRQKASKLKDKSSFHSKSPLSGSRTKKRKRESSVKISKKMIIDNHSAAFAADQNSKKQTNKISQEISNPLGSCELKPSQSMKNSDSIAAPNLTQDTYKNASVELPPGFKLEEGATMDDICYFCFRCDPPFDDPSSNDPVDWLQCDMCKLWFHKRCVDVGQKNKFHCLSCRKERRRKRRERERMLELEKLNRLETHGKIVSESWEQSCLRVLEELWQHDDSQPFRQPVDLTAYPDYLDFVDTPIDLSTIKKKLLSERCYVKVQDFIDDVYLMFRNSRKYNLCPRSPVRLMGLKLHKMFKDREDQLFHKSLRRADSSNYFHVKLSFQTTDESFSAKPESESLSANSTHKNDSKLEQAEVHREVTGVKEAIVENSPEFAEADANREANKDSSHDESNNCSRDENTISSRDENEDSSRDQSKDPSDYEDAESSCDEDKEYNALYESCFHRTLSVKVTDIFSGDNGFEYLRSLGRSEEYHYSSSTDEEYEDTGSSGDEDDNEQDEDVDKDDEIIYGSEFHKTCSIELPDLYNDPACVKYLQSLDKPGERPSTSSSGEYLQGNEDTKSNSVHVNVKPNGILGDSSLSCVANDVKGNTKSPFVACVKTEKGTSSFDHLCNVKIKIEPGLEGK